MQSMITRSFFFISVFAAATYGQSSATLFGRIFDPEGAVVPGATITMANRATGEEWMTQTDDEGNYQIAALPAGIYRIDVTAAGFKTQVVESAFIEVGRTLAQDFHLRVATPSEQLTVTEDVSITKNTVLSERTRMQFRTEVFDLFNHANFGQPGNIVGSPNFGRITSTRFPTGEFGSSRQIQFAIKVLF